MIKERQIKASIFDAAKYFNKLFKFDNKIAEISIAKMFFNHIDTQVLFFRC